MRLRAVLCAALLASCAAAQAASLNVCDHPRQLDTPAADRLLTLAAAVEQTLAGSGESVALIARAGMDLSRIGQRYSHAGVAVRDGARTWSVRQLYLDCAQDTPRIFDQGLPGFVLGQDNAGAAFITLVFLPAEAAASLEVRARAAPDSLSLLGGAYSANAYAFSTRYQNCNQWVAELMALAWGDLPPVQADYPRRAQAQDWLLQAGYVPANIHASLLVRTAALFVPHLHREDHPLEARENHDFAVSMPVALEDFAQRRYPQARRVELCLAPQGVMLREGWARDAAPCGEGAGERPLALRP